MSSSQDLTSARWVKSSYSNGDGGDCVEWAPARVATSAVVPVRDSKYPAGPVLLLCPVAFSVFVRAIGEGVIPQ
ncbi:DUF397 domain-containing protein [Streptomyces liangshanensis]|uniref:DUF397 domain-containing protein n=1 Tax=Streptomyces liangshanensis TaxID=2717324 RepID=A0A6G9H501_9ACTN|nr:DUF397 domain-containing protein [Streptomyces liangshanensis]QIQ05386.1 DUF397 domain-containing protein [Streptomyces liangshanensis]